ncbi:PIN domain-containing protein [Actinophytocola sediminis]
MTTSRPWLIDKSALVRLAVSPQRETWRQRIERGLVHVSTITLLETGYSARSAPDMAAILHQPPLVDMPVEHLTPTAEKRALNVLEALAERGQHRAPSIRDLLIAAIAEQARLVVLHVDKDFELIADITGQPVDRLP